jgi:hypothetical protein
MIMISALVCSSQPITVASPGSESFTALLLMAVASTMLTVPMVTPLPERSRAAIARGLGPAAAVTARAAWRYPSHP